MTRFRIRLVILMLLVSAACLSLVRELDAQTSEKTSADAISTLQMMMIRREILVERFGSTHPAIEKIDSDIATLGEQQPSIRRYVELRMLRLKLAGMDDGELRETLGLLMDRVLELEGQVAQLQRASPQIELLSRKQ